MCGIFGLTYRAGFRPAPQVLKEQIGGMFILSETRDKEAAGLAILFARRIAVQKDGLPASKMLRREKYAGFCKDALLVTSLESAPYAPSSPYSASKAAPDHLVRAYHHAYGLPTLTTNCSSNYGPYQNPENQILLIIKRGLLGGHIPIYGDGLNVARTIWTLLDRLRPAVRPNAELITLAPDRAGHDRRYTVDTPKIEAELDWRPVETFATGIEKTVLWHLEHDDWESGAATRGRSVG